VQLLSTEEKEGICSLYELNLRPIKRHQDTIKLC